MPRITLIKLFEITKCVCSRGKPSYGWDNVFANTHTLNKWKVITCIHTISLMSTKKISEISEESVYGSIFGLMYIHFEPAFLQRRKINSFTLYVVQQTNTEINTVRDIVINGAYVEKFSPHFQSMKIFLRSKQ